MQNSHLENIWFSSAISNPIYIDIVKPSFFKDPKHQEVFKIIKSFWVKYTQIPSLKQVKEVVKMVNKTELLQDSYLEAMWETKISDYDQKWLTENTETWIEWRNLEQSAMDSISYIKSTEVTPENISEVISTYKSIVVDRNNIDFSFDMGLDFKNPESHKQITTNTFPTGYDYLDFCLGGGWSSKSLYVFLGQPKVGKTLWLGNLACQAVRASNNVAIITLELGDRKYIKRLGSNLLNIRMSEYKDTAEDSEKIKKKLKNLAFDNLAIPGELAIKEFPTSQASVLDVEKWLLKVEELRGIKFKVVFIDYINILKNWRNPNSENLYMKIKQIAEDLRAVGQRNNWAIVTATQTKQSEFDATDLSMNSASESSALIATVDGMFGIIQDPLMYANNEYKLKLLANRDEGYKNSYKKFIVDYNYMRIIEDSHSQIMNEPLV